VPSPTKRAVALALTLSAAAFPGAALAAHSTGGAKTPTLNGGASASDPLPKPARGHASRIQAAAVPGDRAVVDKHGLAHPPIGAPDSVKKAIWAGNTIQNKPYKWGGGHGTWKDRGYDCSGTVSYVLHAAGLLQSPLVSGAFARWGEKGPGRWVSIYANSGHAYVYLAGLRLDTSGVGESGPRWRSEPRSGQGFRVRHPRGL
jgi:cell wall-associated NlpC family hydrolase